MIGKGSDQVVSQVLLNQPGTLLAIKSVQIGIGCQIWNVYPLGRLQCTYLRFRMVFAKYVSKASCYDYHRGISGTS